MRGEGKERERGKRQWTRKRVGRQGVPFLAGYVNRLPTHSPARRGERKLYRYAARLLLSRSTAEKPTEAERTALNGGGHIASPIGSLD
jgi:hypothetical protein